MVVFLEHSKFYKLNGSESHRSLFVNHITVSSRVFLAELFSYLACVLNKNNNVIVVEV